MQKNALSLFLRWVCGGLVFLFAAGSLRAVSSDAAFGGASANVTLTYNSSSNEMSWSRSYVSVTPPPYEGQMGLYRVSGGSGSTSIVETIFDLGSPTGSGTTSGTFTAVAGAWYMLYTRVLEGGVNIVRAGPNRTWLQAAAPTEYKVTFAVPANSTDRIIRYEVWQDGAFTGFSVTTSPGDAAREFTAEPLPNDHSATLIEVRANLVQGEDGFWYQGGSDLVRVVNGGTTPVATSATATPGSVASPFDAVSGQPAAPGPNTTTKAPDVAAPTLAPTITPPAAPSPPNPSPSGTGGATKADIEKAANDIAAAVAAVNTQSGTNANAIITAVNNASTAAKDQANAIIKAANTTSTAVDNAAKQVTDGLASVGTKIDATNSKLDSANSKLDTSNTNTAAAVTKLDAIAAKLGPSAEDAATAAATAVSGATTAGTAAGSAAAGWFSANTPATMVPTLETETGILAITMPAEFGGKTFDMNPFTSDRMGGVISWFRAATAWAALVTLGVWVWLQTKGWLDMFSGVQQAKGNTVAGTGGQATAFIAAGLMTAAIVTGVTGMLGWAFGDISFPAIRAAAMTNPLTSMPTKAAWMLDQVFPVATLVSCLLARLSFNMYAAPLFATCQAVVRFIVP